MRLYFPGRTALEADGEKLVVAAAGEHSLAAWDFVRIPAAKHLPGG
jgi:hypothetical protein